MALFDLKAVIDPLAQEFRDGYETLLARLNVTAAHILSGNDIAAAQLDEQRETNRLLRGLISLQTVSNGAPKIRKVGEILDPTAPEETD